MYEQVDKPKENKSKAVANSVAQKKGSGKQGFGFVDNRPEARATSLNVGNFHHLSIAQLKTDIQHTAANITWEGATGKVGKKMVAKLDPTNPVVGSQTDAKLMTPLDTKVAAYNKGMWARGHLLNHDLGGFGVPDNLYPISSGANAHHAQAVEYPVKKGLSAANTNRNTGKADEGVNIFYQVEVKGTPSHSQFHCSWNYADTDFSAIGPKKVSIIESKLNDSKNSDIEEPYFSARGRPESLPTWHHGTRVGTMDGAEGFNDVDRVKSVNDEVGVPSIDPLNVPTAKELNEEQKKEIAEASIAHKLAVSYERKLARIPSEALEQAKEKVAKQRLKERGGRSVRLGVKALSTVDMIEVSKAQRRIESEMRRKITGQYQLEKKRFLK